MKKNTTIEYYECPVCKNVFPIARKNEKIKEFGHIKDLYCFYCDKITKHVKIYK